MKPCFSKRKLVAWLALGELDPSQEQGLRTHLQTCEGCRRYLAELSSVRERLAPKETAPEIEASEDFHRRLVCRLKAENPPPAWAGVAKWLPAMRLNWRLALPAIGAAAVLVAALATFTRQPPVPPPALVSHPVAAPSAPHQDLSPTVANYERVALRSLDELDDLLTRQARRNVALPSTYTAGLMAMANMLDSPSRADYQ
jgi:anti-sigma factor RsiW